MKSERAVTHTDRYPITVTRGSCRRYQAHATVFRDKDIYASGDSEQDALLRLVRLVWPPLFSDGFIAPPRHNEHDGPIIHWYIGSTDGVHALICDQWECPPAE
jgi:hypothetical protein